jgi:hypothetical protein
MGVHHFTTPAGEELVILSKRDYLVLLARSGNEDAEDELLGMLADERREDTLLSAEQSRKVVESALGRRLDD